jgi:hypothetical protein
MLWRRFARLAAHVLSCLPCAAAPAAPWTQLGLCLGPATQP